MNIFKFRLFLLLQCISFVIGSNEFNNIPSFAIASSMIGNFKEENINIENNNNFNISEQTRRKLLVREVVAVHIVGERNSGTNWLEEVIKENFKVPKVTNVLCQYKHWFQSPCELRGPYIVTVLIRNPYDW